MKTAFLALTVNKGNTGKKAWEEFIGVEAFKTRATASAYTRRMNKTAKAAGHDNVETRVVQRLVLGAEWPDAILASR